MDSHDVENYFASHKSILAVLLIIVGIASVSGYFMGMRNSSQSPEEISPWRAAPAPDVGESENYPEAPLYKDIPTTKWKANKDWVNSLSNLPHQKLDRTARKPLTEEERKRIMRGRAERRAYDGAPPMIPHAINYRDVESCVACHSQDANVIVGGKRTPAMSHPYMTNCTQCHAPAGGLGFMKVHSGTTALVVTNNFKGNPAAGKGSRAYPGAPPAMPHRVWMRQNCMSCHGPGMPDAITTSHPQRANCLQCHAQNSEYDNREQARPLTSSQAK